MPALRAVALAVAVLAAGCAAGDGSPEVPDGPPGRPLFGFNDNSVRAGLASPAQQASLAAGAGARVVRLTFDWRFAERRPGAYDFAVYDGIYRALRKRRIAPLWIVMFAPDWARDPDTGCAADCRFPPSRAGEARYGALAARIARRYPRSAGIEVWNEPNLTTFWQPRPDAHRYTRLLRTAHSAVKRVAPRMPVVNGGLSNNRVTENGNVAMREFLAAMYDAGAKRAMDAVSFHPYPVSRSEPLLLPSVADVLDVLRENGDESRPLWITELGATREGPDPDLRYTPSEQAETLAEGFCRLARVPTVKLVLAHTLLTDPRRAGDPEAGYSLVSAGGTPTPALRALARRAKDGCG